MHMPMSSSGRSRGSSGRSSLWNSRNSPMGVPRKGGDFRAIVDGDEWSHGGGSVVVPVARVDDAEGTHPTADATTWEAAMTPATTAVRLCAKAFIVRRKLTCRIRDSDRLACGRGGRSRSFHTSRGAVGIADICPGTSVESATHRREGPAPNAGRPQPIFLSQDHPWCRHRTHENHV
jgi:hypothetical protein